MLKILCNRVFSFVGSVGKMRAMGRCCPWLKTISKVFRIKIKLLGFRVLVSNCLIRL